MSWLIALVFFISSLKEIVAYFYFLPHLNLSFVICVSHNTEGMSESL